MSADDMCSPVKKSRTESTTVNCCTPQPHPTTPTTTAAASTPPPNTKATTASCAGDKEASTSCLESCHKDSIIAQILAGADSDFGESTLCPPGVFFDESCYQSTANVTPCSFSPQDSWTGEQPRTPTYSSSHPVAMMSSAVTKETRSLLVAVESRGCSLHHNIEQVVADHELVTCSPGEALTLCNERVFQLIWLQLPCPPTEDFLGVITGIRYSSKYNRKTIQLGVTVTQPEIDLNLHGIDEIILEPVSKSTIRQKYFDWTSVKLVPDYELSLRDPQLSPTTPESSVSTESNIELSLSSLASDTTNDSGIQAEVDVVDLKPPPAFLFRPQPGTPGTQGSKGTKLRPINGSPSTPPSWCRAEHATKEKHRRERIKDSCDQLRVLLPYVRGRKTDMASILEMTVDYLKIVNSKLPHEFHAHVLDIMTKTSNSPPSRPPRTQQLSSGRGSRSGGRGRASRRSSASPARSLNVQDASAQGRTLSRALSHGTTSTPVCASNTRGNGGPRGNKIPKRGSQSSVVMSPGHGVSSLYLADSKDRVVQREGVISNTMSLPTYIQPTHYTSSHPFSDTLSSASHTYAPPPGPSGLSTSSASDCGLSVPRLYASAHLTVEPGFLSHGAMGNPSPLTTPMPTRYTLGGDRDGGGGSGLSASFGDTSTPAYYHYFSNVPEINPAYTVAGGGGAGCGGGVPMCGDFMSSGSLLPMSANSAFAPARMQVAPSRGKGELTSQSSVSGCDNSFGMMDTTPKTPK